MLQFIDSLMEDVKTKQRALQALVASSAFEEVKQRVVEEALAKNAELSRIDQVSLFKIGGFTDNSWNVLRCALKEKVKLAGPSTLRRVRD